MELYIVRHGDAVDQISGGYTRDADRPLSPLGEDEVDGLAAGLARLGLTPDRLLTSPLVRARQTAERLAQGLALPAAPVICPDLAPGGELADIVAATRGGRRVIVVGHMPTLSELIGWLVWGDPVLAVPLRTAGLCRIDVPTDPAPGRGELRWLLPPKLSARLR